MFVALAMIVALTSAEITPPVSECSASHDESGLSVEPCSGTVRVIGTQGSHVFHCDNLRSAIFYGPVHITVDHMTCQAMTREPCAELIDQRPFSLNCRDAWHHVTWAMIIGAGMIAGSIFFTLRIRSIHLRVSHSMARITRRRFTLYGAVYEWDEPGTPEFRGDRYVTPVATRSRRVFWAKFVMWSFAFWIQPAVGVELRIAMNPGSSLAIGRGLIVTHGTEMRHLMTPVYRTGTFSFKMAHDSHCLESSCNRYGPCENFGPSGGQALKHMKAEGSGGHRWMPMRWCVRTKGSCLLWSGCSTWVIDLIVKAIDLWQVHRLGSKSEIFHISDRDSSCVYRSHRMEPTVDLSRFTVLTRGDDALLCPYPDSYDRPYPFTLGDLQISTDWQMTFDMRSIICDKPPLLDPLCSLPGPGLDKVIDQCHKLPYEDEFMKVYLNDSVLVSQEKGSLKLTLMCDDNTYDPEVDCGGIKQTVVGMRDSPTGLHLIVKPVINTTTGAWTGVPLCHHEKITIPCNSPPIAIPLSLFDNCNIKRELDQTKEAEFHSYGGYQPSHPLDNHPDATSPEEALWTLIRSLHMKIIGGSSIGLLVTFLLLIICIKR